MDLCWVITLCICRKRVNSGIMFIIVIKFSSKISVETCGDHGLRIRLRKGRSAVDVLDPGCDINHFIAIIKRPIFFFHGNFGMERHFQWHLHGYLRSSHRSKLEVAINTVEGVVILYYTGHGSIGLRLLFVKFTYPRSILQNNSTFPLTFMCTQIWIYRKL